MRRLSVVVFAGLALWLFAASPAGAVRTEYFGISQGRELDTLDLRGMAAARVRTDRFLFQWRSIVENPGQFDWTQPDRVIGSLAFHGIRPLPFVWGCPDWVCPGPSRPPTDTTTARTAWQNFLKAAVGRYGRGGSFWTNVYHQRYGQSAPEYPITAWQVWNEPNLKKYFDPGRTTGHGINKYAQLVKMSRDAIKSRDPQAVIVLAGMLGNGDPLAWDFLKGLYKISGFKNNFDVAALHPYTGSLDGFRRQILQFRGVMSNAGDSATPLWLSEFGWGSANPDRFGINKGLQGQALYLRDSFEMLLKNRRAWNVQRLYWFLWRDPATGGGTGCSFCGSAGLLKFNRTKKPAYSAFTRFASESAPPTAGITAGPAHGSFIKDLTPTFSFAAVGPTDYGSTFVCRLDGGAYKPCSPPYTTPPLSNATHTFYLRAIDAPGNVSAIVARSFTVDTQPPQTTITSGPAGSTSDATPTMGFTSNEQGSTFRCRFDAQPFAGCSGPGARHTPSTPLSNGGHSFEVRAIDRATNADPTPARRTFTVTP